jgi:hypothetical protein
MEKRLAKSSVKHSKALLLFSVFIFFGGSVCVPTAASAHDISTYAQFIEAFKADPNIRGFLAGDLNPSFPLLVDVIRFGKSIRNETANAPHGMSLSQPARDVFSIAEEMAKRLPSLSDAQRRALYDETLHLFVNSRSQIKLNFAIRIFDLFWLWTPDQLEVLARKILNSPIRFSSTQTLWLLQQASREQQAAFFHHVRHMYYASASQRWFILALKLKFDALKKTELFSLVKYLRFVNPHNVEQMSTHFIFRGERLPTASDLYWETIVNLRAKAEAENPVLLSARAMARSRNFPRGTGIKSGEDEERFVRFVHSLFDECGPHLSI